MTRLRAVSRGLARSVLVVRSLVRQGMVTHRVAARGDEGLARPDCFRRGKASSDGAKSSKARPIWATQGGVRSGTVAWGRAWCGAARLGVDGCGKVCHGPV